eukprot:995469-Prorocentrum_minimum.AAC.1
MSMCFVLELFTSFWAMNPVPMLSMYVLTTGVFTGMISLFLCPLEVFSKALIFRALTPLALYIPSHHVPTLLSWTLHYTNDPNLQPAALLIWALSWASSLLIIPSSLAAALATLSITSGKSNAPPVGSQLSASSATFVSHFSNACRRPYHSIPPPPQRSHTRARTKTIRRIISPIISENTPEPTLEAWHSATGGAQLKRCWP